MIRRSQHTVTVLIMLLFLSFPLTVKGAELPKPRGAINDFAGVLSPQYESAMASLAREVREKTGTSVVIATITRLDGDSPADYANRLYEAWGIGEKGVDKGVLIFLAKEERRIRIETGYGVEGILPDGLVGEILDESVIPFLKENKYNEGLASALVRVSQIIADDAGVTLTGQSSTAPARRPVQEKPEFNLFSFILLLIVLSMLFGTRRGRSMLPFLFLLLMMGGGGRGGGGFGGFGGGFGGFGGGMSGGGGAGRGF